MAPRTPSPKLRRVVGRAMRAPAVLDRRGLRWLLGGLSAAPVVVLVHRGRRSGKTYKTPVDAMLEDRARGEIVISPMWGESSDWYRNVVAGGLVEAHVGGESRRYKWRHLSDEEKLEAIAAYRRKHRLYSALLLRVVARLHGLPDHSVETVAGALPMLSLRAGEPSSTA